MLRMSTIKRKQFLFSYSNTHIARLLWESKARLLFFVFFFSINFSFESVRDWDSSLSAFSCFSRLCVYQMLPSTFSLLIDSYLCSQFKCEDREIKIKVFFSLPFPPSTPLCISSKDHRQLHQDTSKLLFLHFIGSL